MALRLHTVFGVFFAVLALYGAPLFVAHAAWDHTPYAAGQTLNPECGPTDENCTVNTNYFSQPVGFATTTPAATVEIAGSGRGNTFLGSGSSLLNIDAANEGPWGLTFQNDVAGMGNEVGFYLGNDGTFHLSDNIGHFLFNAFQNGNVTLAQYGGRVGVGTSNPQSTLDVGGDIGISGYNRYLNFNVDNFGVGSGGFGLRDNGGTIQYKNLGGSWTDLSQSAWETNGSGIDYGGGSVGIGTTEPKTTLTVNGALSTLLEGDVFKQYDPTTGEGNLYPLLGRYFDESGSPYSGMTFLFGSGPSAAVGIEKPGGDKVNLFRVRADNSTFTGNVGIGTTNPTSKLDVVSMPGTDVGDSVASFTSNDTWQSGFTVSNTSSEAAWSFMVGGDTNNYSGVDVGNFGFYNAASGNFPFIMQRSSNNVILTRDNGRVGIGTSNPNAKLQVDGLVTGDSFGVGQNTWLTNSAPWYGIGLSDLSLPRTEDAGRAVQVAGYGGLNFITSGGQMVLNDQGKVGIGTNDPQSTLDVNGDIRITGSDHRLYFSDGSSMWTSSSTNASGVDSEGDINFTTGGQINLITGDGFATSSKLTVKNNGWIGIGTQDPTSPLDIYDNQTGQRNLLTLQSFFDGGDQGPGILFRDTNNPGGDGAAGIRAISSGQGEAGLAFDTNYSGSLNEAMRIDSRGRVGVGTNNPDEMLQVNGRASADSFSVGQATEDNFNNSPWYGIGQSNITLPGTDYEFGTAVQVAGYYGLLFQAAGGQAVFNQQGNFGIGTTAPATMLDVAGSARLTSTTGDTYLNFGTSTTGADGYGVRFHAGVMQFRNNGGDWTDLGTGYGTPTTTINIAGPGGNDGLKFSSTYSSPTGWAGNVIGSSTNYLYVQNNNRGFDVVDITNRAHPVRVASYQTGSSWINQSFSFGSTVYLIGYDGRYHLEIIDVSDPTHPVETGTYYSTSADHVYQGAAWGGEVYLKNDNGYIEAVNVSNPASPQVDAVIHAHSDDGPFWNPPHASGNRLFVADYNGDVEIFDVTDPTAPVWKSNYHSAQGWAYHYTISGNYLYENFNNFEVVDIHDLTSPTLVATYSSPSSWIDAPTVSGAYAYAENNNSQLEAIDISNPAAPTFVTTYASASGWLNGSPFIDNGYLYTENNNNQLEAIDISNPHVPIAATFTGGRVGVGTLSPDAALSVVGTGGNVPVFKSHYISPTNYLNTPFVLNSIAYSENDNGAIEIIDETDPTHPVLDATYASTTGSLRVPMAAGNALYAVNNSDGSIEVVDVTNKSAPTYLTSLVGQEGSTFNYFTISGSHLYAVDTAGNLEIFNISDPSNITLDDAFTASTGLDYNNVISAQGTWVYVRTTDEDIDIIDASTPSAPTDEGTYSPHTGIVRSFFAADGVLYIQNSSYNIEIADLQTPSSPVYRSTYDVPTNLFIRSGAEEENRFLYIPDNDCSIEVVDVNDQYNPRLVSVYKGPSNCAGNAFVDSNKLYVINGNDQLEVADISSVPHPSSAATFEDGLVGIGTNTPHATLDVNGNVALSGYNRYFNFNADNSGVGQNGYGFRDNSGTIQYKNAGGTWSDFSAPSGWVAESDGSTRFGSGTYTLSGLPTKSSDITDGLFLYPVNVNSNTDWRYYIDDDSTDSLSFYGNSCASDCHNASAASVIMHLNASGEVGIGTSTPAAKLDVAGSARLIADGDAYLNFNSTTNYAGDTIGNGGYGIRMHNGVMQFRNESGDWTDMGSGTGSISSTTALTLIGTTTPPVISGTSTYGDWPTAVAIQGHYAYSVNSNSGSFTVTDITNHNSPVVVDVITGLGSDYDSPEDIAVAGHYAYVTSEGNERLYVVDISNAENVSVVGSYDFSSLGNGPDHIKVEGSYAYVTAPNAGLAVLNIQNPLNITLTGFLKLPGADPLTVQGSYVYVSDVTTNDVYAINVADPAHPAIVGGISVASAYGLDMAGRYLYVASNNSGELTVIDAADPSSLSFVTSVETDNYPGFVKIEGKRAYVSTSNGLDVFDISDPTSPVFVSTALSGTYVVNFDTDGQWGYALVEGIGGALLTVDLGSSYIQNLAAGGIKTTSLTIEHALSAQSGLFQNGVSVGGSVLANGGISAMGQSSFERIGVGTTTMRAGLDVVGSSNDQVVTLTSASATSTGNIVDMAWGDGVLAAAEDGTVTIWTTSGTTLQWQSTITATDSIKAVAIVGSLLLVGDGRYLKAYAITDPTNPTYQNEVYTGEQIRGITTYGNIAYVVNDASVIETYDLAVLVGGSDNPFLGYASLSGTPYHVKLSADGNYAYVSEWGRVQVIDVSNLTSPVSTGAYAPGDIGGGGIAVGNGYAYTTRNTSDGKSFVVLDTSDPTNPVPVGYADIGIDREYTGMVVVGSTVYVSDGDLDSVYAINVSKPTHPVVVGHSPTQSSYNRAIATDGSGNLFVGEFGTLEGFSTSAQSLAALFMNGNVGIGTSQPQAQLEISGQGSGNFFGDPTLLAIHTQDGTPWGIAFVNDAAGSNIGFGEFLTNDGTLVFEKGDDMNNLSLTQDGLMGIGTRTPDAKLTIANGGIHLTNTGDNYINFGEAPGELTGAEGYGIRIHNGAMQFKNEGGDWTDMGSGGGGNLSLSGSMLTTTLGTTTQYTDGTGAFVDGTTDHAVIVGQTITPAHNGMLQSVEALIRMFDVDHDGQVIVKIYDDNNGTLLAQADAPQVAPYMYGAPADTTWTFNASRLMLQAGHTYDVEFVSLSNNDIMLFEADGDAYAGGNMYDGPYHGSLTPQPGNDLQFNVVYGGQTGGLVEVGSLASPLSLNLLGSTTPMTLASTSVGQTPWGMTVAGGWGYVANGESGTLSVLSLSNPLHPQTVATLSGFGQSGGPTEVPEDVAVQGSYAYVTSEEESRLYVVDISNRAKPAIISSVEFGDLGGSNSPDHVVVQGQYAYVADEDQGLVIINIGDPKHPTIASRMGNNGSPEQLAVRGKYVYITNTDQKGLDVVDVSDPSAPHIVGHDDIAGGPYGVTLDSRYAYVTLGMSDSGGQLVVVDIADPTAPHTVATLPIAQDGANFVAIQGKLAYVTGDNGLSLVDISDPTNPQLVGTSNEKVALGDMAIEGRYLFATQMDSGSVYVLDLGGSYIQQLEAGGIKAGSLSVTGNFSAQSGSIAGALSVGGLTAQGPAAIHSLLQVFGNGGTNGARYTATYRSTEGLQVPSTATTVTGRQLALFGTDGDGFEIIDVTNPNSPVIKGRYSSVNSPFSDPYVAGTTAYGANTNGNLEAVDITDPTNPQFGSETAGDVPLVSVAGVEASTTASSTIYAIDAAGNLEKLYADPSDGTSVAYDSTYVASHALEQVQFDFAHEMAYGVNSNHQIEVVNLVNMSNITSFEGLAPIFKIALSGNYVYATNNYGQLMSLHSNSNGDLQQVGIYNTTNACITTGTPPVIHGSYAFVLTCNNAFEIVDISNPVQMSYVGTYASPTGSLNYAAIIGNNLYSIDDNNNLEIIDASSPKPPVAATFTGGHVGVGTTNPGAALSVVGEGGSTVTTLGQYQSPSTDLSSNYMVDGDYVYALNNNSAIEIIDERDTARPQRVAVITDKNFSQIDVQGDLLAATASDGSGLRLYDTADKAHPIATSTIAANDTGDSGHLVWPVIVGNRLFAIDTGNNQLEAFDISDPSNPSYLGNYASVSGDGLSTSFRIAVQGTVAYVYNQDNQIELIDVHDPTDMAPLSTWTGGSGASGDFSVSGQYLFQRNNGGNLEIVSVANPASPSAITTFYPDSSLGTLTKSMFYQGHLYVPDDCQIDVLDLTDPSSPVRVDTYHSPSSCASEPNISQNGKAFVYNDSDGIEAINIAGISQKNMAATFVNGLVGIGTDNPDAQLDVSGTFAASGALRFGSGTYWMNNVPTLATNANEGLFMYPTQTGGGNSTDYQWIIDGGFGGSMSFWGSIPFGNHNAQDTSLIMYMDAYNNRVGIGTSNPHALLDVNGDVAISGYNHYINFNADGSGVGSGGYGIRDTGGTMQFKNSGGTWTNFGAGTLQWTDDGMGNIAYNSGSVSIGGNVSIGNGAVSYDSGSGVTAISNLSIGALNFPLDAGMVQWVDLPVSAAPAGTEEGYSAMIGGAEVLTVYGESNGDGTVGNLRVGIGTTTPVAVLDVESTTSFALLPRMDNLERDAISLPQTGGLIFNTASSTLQYFATSTPGTVETIGTLAADQAVYDGPAEGQTYTTTAAGRLTQIEGSFAIRTAPDSVVAKVYDAPNGKLLGVSDNAVSDSDATEFTFVDGTWTFNNWAVMLKANTSYYIEFTAVGNNNLYFDTTQNYPGSGGVYAGGKHYSGPSGSVSAHDDMDLNMRLTYGGSTGGWSDVGYGGAFEWSNAGGTGAMSYVGGNVGIGTTSPWTTFAVQGTVAMSGLSTETGMSGAALCLTASGEVVVNSGVQDCTLSSERYKHNIEGLDISGTSTIMELSPSSFVYNSDTASTTHWGFIAEALASTSPELAQYGLDGKPQSVNQIGILAVVVKAVQELTATIQGFAERFTSKEVDTQKLCVGDTCVTQDQLKALLQAAGSSSTPAAPSGAATSSDSTSGTDDSASSTPADTEASSTPPVAPTDTDSASTSPDATPAN